MMNQPYPFISYSSADSEIADQLCEDLKKHQITPWIYKINLDENKQWAKQIDEALSDSSIVLGIITKNYENSAGMIEFYAQISSNFNKADLGYIPLFFTQIKNVKSKFLKSIEGIPFKNYSEGLAKLIERLKPKEDSGILLSKIESPSTPNPFRRARAEVFGNDYLLIARAFAMPEKEKYDRLLEATPTIILGGRGSGKTMMLKSLTPEVQLYIKKVKTVRDLKKLGLNYIGFYFRLEIGSLLIYDNNIILEAGFAQSRQEFDINQYKTALKKINNLNYYNLKSIGEDPILSMGINAAWTISLNELNFKILKKFLKKLKELSQKTNPIININENIEKVISEKVSQRLNIQNVTKSSFNELIEFLDGELSLISSYLQELVLPYGAPKPIWHKTDIKFIDDIIEILKQNIDDLQNLNFFLLFDEFENLRPYQQTIIIEWVKTAKNFFPKISSKYEGIYTNLTLQGQPLQYGQDCPFPIELDYDLLDKRKKRNYQNFLIQICHNLMEIEGWNNTNITEMLPNFNEVEVPQKSIDKLIKEIRENAGLDYTAEKKVDYYKYLKNAAIFRLLKKRDIQKKFGKLKIYAGFKTFSLLSSGIIRIFMNLAAMSVYRAIDEGINVKLGEPIPFKCQSSAAYTVSKGWLEKIPENYDFQEYGLKIYQLIVDIGYILRQKLLHHPTEPESICFTLIDPSNLNKHKNQKINVILRYAVRESILYCRRQSSAIVPKSKGETKPKEYILNRIYAPILRISHRTQWNRNHISVDELKNLLNEKIRQKNLNIIIARIKREDTNVITLDEWVEKNNEE